jgi:site-specific DNA-cytosine methylase
MVGISVEEVKTLWFTKSRRAQNVDDYETWIEGGVMPTLNSFDNGDVRTTVIVFHPHYHDGARVQGDTMNTLTSRMGTGGNNVSGVATVKAYDEYNDSIADTHHTLRSGTKQSTGVIMESNVRRLTPVECERLQGFPDDWTEGQSDSHRYKQMGNAVAVPVVEWIIQGISDTL